MKLLGAAVTILAVFARRYEASRKGCLGLIVLILALTPWPARADESWTAGRQFGLDNADTGNLMPPATAEQVVAALTPGSVLIAQAGGSTEPPAEGWRFSVAPYFWMARTKTSLDVGQFSRSTTSTSSIWSPTFTWPSPLTPKPRGASGPGSSILLPQHGAK